MPGPYIIGNWKMHGTRAQAVALVEAVAKHVDRRKSPKVVICPPFTLLAQVLEGLEGPLRLGAQDCHAAGEGAFTGDISAAMLKDAGCDYVIVGHSERRAGHGEGNDLVRAKAAAALDVGLTPIICVGETLEQRQSGQADAVVSAQLAGSLPKGAKASQFLLAYEPVWAIGSGLAATASDIAEMHAQIGMIVPGCRVLYGGSVKPENAAEILALPGVDGVLVGGASLKAEQFCAIIDAAR